jgi:hypothetical protein
MRGTHLVGSLPAPGPGQAMDQALAVIGRGLRSLPGDWSDHDDLQGSSLDFGHVRKFERSFPLFLEARERAEMPRLAFQVGVPGDLDTARFVLGPRGALLRRRAFTDATVDEIAAIHSAAGYDVIFQVELPVELVAVARTPRALQPAIALLLARGVANLARRSPSRTRFGVHLCLGDISHGLRDTAPLVTMANALARSWPDDRPLEFMHVPFAAAEIPPPVEASFYAPLSGLRLKPGTRLIAGVAHEDQALDEQRSIVELIERRVGGPVAISHSCGLGRRSPEAAERALWRVAELANPV